MKSIYRSTTTHKAAAFICGLCLLLILLITSLQAVCYWIPDWWRNEYAKYDTPSNVRGEMSLDDAVHVTEDMLEYCIGRLDTLDDTEATIDGVTAPFFTDREKAHLADCRELFHKGIQARVIACLMLAAFVIFIYVHNGKQKTSVLLAKGYLRSLGFIVVLAAVIAVLCVIDFTQVFTVFHHIFFDNDLWILYPDKDNLINIMQEDVFSDAAMWIAGIWLAASALIAAVSVIVIRKDRYSVKSAVE
ncbi:MAG: TIGR01906 family membrane protein [Mogibacterium sp.]|nr:TIGR01906 family membrane protein [Mogibacterium sp.]